MPSDNVDPALRAETTNLAHDLEAQLRRRFLPAARQYLKGWNARLECAEALQQKKSSLLEKHSREELELLLPDLVKWDSSSFLSDRERKEIIGSLLDDRDWISIERELNEEKRCALDSLLGNKLSVVVAQKTKQRLARHAGELRDERTCRGVARALVERLSTTIRELFELFGESASTWNAKFERGLLFVLQQIAKEDSTASSGRRMTDEGVVTRTEHQTGASTAFPSPPETGAPVAAGENASLIQRIQSSSRTKALTTLLGLVKSENPELDETRALLLASDKRIEDIRSEAEQKRCYREVHDSVPDGWKDGIGEQKTLVAYWDMRDPKERGPIKSYVSRASSHLRQNVM
jgi:hypothetical protein